MKFTQTQTTKTTLGPKIAIGEFEGHITHAKPGNYLVYDVKRETGISDSALLFIHEDEVQDINTLLPILDIDTSCGIDGGTYGIITKPEGSEFTADEWFDRLEDYNNDNQNCIDGYVSYTNYGDGRFSVYTNEGHSVFLLDDCDIYLQVLLDEQGIDYNEIELLEGYTIGDKIQVGYYVELDREYYKHNMMERPIDENPRKITTLVNMLMEVARLTPRKDTKNENESR